MKNKHAKKESVIDRNEAVTVNEPLQIVWDETQYITNVKDFIQRLSIRFPENEYEEHLWPLTVKYNEVLKDNRITDELLRSVYDECVNEKLKFPPALSFNQLLTRQFPKARYVLDPFFEEGTVNMVSAPPNTWKSWLLFLFAVHIAEGKPLFEKFETSKTSVMIVNEEDSYRAVQDRFNILGVVDKHLQIYFRIAQGSKLKKEFMKKLLEECKEKKIGLVMFDSLRAMHESDENDSTAMQGVMDSLKQLSREGITVVFTHHHRKKSMFGKGDEAEASRGSSAINAAISGHLSLEEESRETGLFLVVRHLKSKAGEKLPPFELKIDKEVEGKLAFVYEGEFKSTEKKLTVAKDAIIDYLRDEEWRSVKDFMSLGIASKGIVRTALSVLKRDGLIEGLLRGRAFLKSSKVDPKGNPKEMFYKLNETTNDENDSADRAFNNL